MALTRAQLLAGNDNDGVVLPGQPQGVIAGTGITISNTGVISVDSSTITGFVRLNNPLGYNSYTWPQIPGVSGQFLQTSGVSGVLTWADAKGFAVVTVQPAPAPSPPDEGELWFDCSTGTLKIYQTCVAPGGWTDVNQSGLPVDPAQTTSSVPWTGTGTTGDPYVMSVTTVGAGSSVFVVNTVTVGGLAPYQYVPIVDLNAVANGGRFSFSNYYADATGALTFQTIFTDQPASPPTTTYTANIRVGYATAYINAVVNIVTPLALTQGVISGTPTVNTAVSYTPGTPSGGLTPYTTAYQWFADGSPILGATSSSYTPVTGDVGKTLSVTQTVTDATGASVSSTATAGSATSNAPIPNWTPTGSMNTIPGGLSGTYSGPGTTMTATGCIEVSINGGSYGAGGPVTSGQVVAIRWKSTATCGGAATPTVIQGSLTDGVGQNDYSVTVNRVPSPTINDISDTNVPLNATVSEGIASPITGLTTTAYVTYDASSTGTTIGASLTPGGPFTALATSGQGFAITNGQTLYIEQTVGSGLGVGYTAVIRVGDGTNAAGTYDEFVYTATTTLTPAFPNTVFGPSASDPNATPDTVSIAADPQLGALEGTAVTDLSGWQDGNGVNLTATNMLLSVNGAPFASSVTVSNGNSLAVAWDPAYISGITDGTAVTGDFTDTTYTNSYGYTVDKDPAFALPAPPPAAAATNAPLGGTVATGVLTVDEYNSPIDVTISSVTTGTAIDLTNVAYEIDTNGQVPVASLPHTFTLNPGESVQFFGDTGTATLQEYGYTVTMGAAPAQEWLVETANATPSIGTPTIDLPLGNATNVNPGVNSPSEILIEGSAYDPQNGAGAQTSGIFELYEAIPFNPETSVITGVGFSAYSLFLTNTRGSWFSATYNNTAPFRGAASQSASVSGNYTISFNPPSPITGTSIWTAVVWGTGNVGWEYRINGGVWQDAYNTIRVSPQASTTAPAGWLGPTLSPAAQVWWDISAYAPISSIEARYVTSPPSGSSGPSVYPIVVDGVQLIDTTTLTLTDAQDLADMQVGDTLTQDSPYTPLTSLITSVTGNIYSSTVVNASPASSALLAFNGVLTNWASAAINQTLTWNASSYGLSGNLRVYVYRRPEVTISINGGGAVATGASNLGFGWFDCGAVGSITSIALTGSGGQGTALAAVEVNGVILIDNTTLTLTDDTDLYNFAVGDVVWSNPGYLSSFSSDTTLTNPQYAFDGDLATTTTGGVAATLTFAPSPGIVCNSSLRIYMNVDRGQQVYVNGVQQLASIVAGWNTVPVTTPITITSLVIGPSDAISSNNLNAIEVDGVILVDPQGTVSAIDSISVPPTITLSPSTGTWNTNSQIQGVASTGTGSITSINSGSAPYTVTLRGSPRGWGANAGKYGIDSRFVAPSAPTTEPPDPTYYTATTGSPYASTTPVPPTKPSANVPEADLSLSTTYYTRAKYSTTSPSNIDSNYSAWSKFTTASTFYPFQPGDQAGGGYFVAQIMVFAGEDDGVSPAVDTIYNLIVAPTIGDNTGPNAGGTLLGQYSTDGGLTVATIQWKNVATGETGADIPLAQNLVYGKPWTDRAGTTGNFPVGDYPLFQWCVGDANGPNGGGGIGGFTDWYIPAKNELAILYFFLKPSTSGNSSTSGSGINPNSLPPYTPNTSYGVGFPNQTGSTLFQTGGAQALVTSKNYWASSEISSRPPDGWIQNMDVGRQGSSSFVFKTYAYAARAVRRVVA